MKHRQGFVYYILKYDDFINANASQYHFAINGDPNDVDWIALGSYSSNPGTAYHTDPFAVAVERTLLLKYPNINLALYKQYSGKCPLSIIKDKIHWDPMFSVISRKDGWYVVLGGEYLTTEIRSEFNVHSISETEYLIPKRDDLDMVQICVNLFERISNNISFSK